jgi:hypothetical protein
MGAAEDGRAPIEELFVYPIKGLLFDDLNTGAKRLQFSSSALR